MITKIELLEKIVTRQKAEVAALAHVTEVSEPVAELFVLAGSRLGAFNAGVLCILGALETPTE